MIHEHEIKAYKAIMPEIMATEFYVGMVYFSFYFTIAEYRATCTEAFPFNPFDKLICELLKVEDSLSFNEIGDILGLNVYESDSPQKKLDLAEREILTDAIQSLASEEFGQMVETGDIHMSKCSLTVTGREYAEKKSKFKVTENKPFTIFFDHTTGNHQLAKENFEFIKGTKASVEFDISFANEVVLKEIAQVQVPEIYNPEKQYSFTDPVMFNKETFEIELPVAVAVNAQNNSTRLFCLDKKSKSVNKYFTDWINNSPERKNEILEALKRETTTANSIILGSHIKLFSDRKLLEVKSELIQQDLIDDTLFLLSMVEIIEPSVPTTLYLTLPIVNTDIINSIIQCTQKSNSTESRFFIVLHNETKGYGESVESLFDLASRSPNLYCLERAVRRFFLGVKAGSTCNYYSYCYINLGGFNKELIRRNQWNEKSIHTEEYILKQFCEESALELCSCATQAINENIDKEVTAAQIKKLKEFKFKLLPFKDIGPHSNTVSKTLKLIDVFITDRIKVLHNSIAQQLDAIEEGLSKEIDQRTINLSQELFNQINKELISNHDDLLNRIKSVRNLILVKKTELEESRKMYHIILDTNILVHKPKILTNVDQKHRIIIAAKVLDELDNFKRKPELQKTASECISLIFKNPNKNIHRAKANLKLLPPDFSSKSPDNLILATALAYKTRNGILITDDKGLLEKAKHCELDTLNLKEFTLKFLK